MKNRKLKQKKTFLECIDSFSKWITVVWLIVWVEIVLFSQVVVFLGFGDLMTIATLNENIKEIGLVICGFYFGKSAIENCFQGYEEHLREISKIKNFEEDN